MSMGIAVMMVVVAMLVMVMVIMMMTITMVIAMIVRCVVQIAVGRMRVATAGIGAAFGIERRFDLDHAGAETFHHPLNHVIAPDTQTPGPNLRRQITFAEIPAHPTQRLL